MTTDTALLARVTAALDRVVDPCSVGRGVPAGLVDMGMVKSVAILDADAGPRADILLRTTSPGCHLQVWFTERVVDEVAAATGIRDVHVDWSTEFDWSDDDMSDSLKARLRAKREGAKRDRAVR
ncbi:iron-sulfur cluster assembly protein [Mycolicibacterium sp.]|uniref:iron-sulfur cluster assembly protein n=1 Tax=Mycolicibacterium sp. TaxID=2320850 RepID=UPI003D13A47B